MKVKTRFKTLKVEVKVICLMYWKVRVRAQANLLDSPAVDELKVKTLTSVPMLLRTLLPFAEHSFSNLDARRN